MIFFSNADIFKTIIACEPAHLFWGQKRENKEEEKRGGGSFIDLFLALSSPPKKMSRLAG